MISVPKNTLSALCCVLFAVGCAPQSEPAAERPSAPVEIAWTATDDAAQYSVRAWAGPRLLFETVTSDTRLVLDESQRRLCAAFDSVEVRVRVAREGASPIVHRAVLTGADATATD